MLMRISIAQVLLVLSVSVSFAQSDINFENYFPPALNAPVSNALGMGIVGPSTYVADLFWSSNTNATMDDLIAVGSEAGFSPSATNGGGYFFGGSRTLPVPETPVVAQVRVWDEAYGATYYGARNAGGEFGFSNLIIVTPSIPPGMATPLFGLEGFQLQRLPRVTTTLTTTNTLLFSWTTEQTNYALQQNPDLSPTNWTTLSNAPVTIGQEQEVVVPVPTTGRMFYRLASQY